MTDNTAALNTLIGLPCDLVAEIAHFLDIDDLAKFKQICKVAQVAASNVIIVLQPLYNHLYAIDKTLPPLLPQEGALIAFKQAFEKIQARQQSEIIYLTEHHPGIVLKLEYTQVLQESSAVSIKSLEAREGVLNNINSAIIERKIAPFRPTLNLSKAGITRLPVTLFQSPDYAHFWRNLTHLTCNDNFLAELDVRELPALQVLCCHDNQLTALNVQGLMALKQLFCDKNQLTALEMTGLSELEQVFCDQNQLIMLNMHGLLGLQISSCHNNHLTTLNVQGLSSLRQLFCFNNPLTDLNLTGVHAHTKNMHAELEKRLLFTQLNESICDKATQAIITRLGVDYTYANCFNYCPEYTLKLCAHDAFNGSYSLASRVLTHLSTFLPSFSANNNAQNITPKRSQGEDQILTELDFGQLKLT